MKLGTRSRKRLWDSVSVTRGKKRIELKAHGISLRIQEIGRGPNVLLIHGGPNAGSTFAQLVCHLPGFHCLTVDRPGTGLSQPLRIDAENLARYGDTFVADVLDGLGLERTDVIGSSFGGFLVSGQLPLIRIESTAWYRSAARPLCPT